MNPQLAKLLTEELETARRELAEARAVAKAANEKVHILELRVERWEGALSEATGKKPEGVPPVEPESGEIGESASAVNKAQVLRDVLRANGDRGATMKDIRDEYRNRGIAIHQNYPYSVIRRGKKNKTIRERNGKYYLAEPKKAEELALANG